MADLNESLAPGSPVDLTNCDREPIHIPGSVQTHATLLVLEEPSLIIRQVSANAPGTLGVRLEALLGGSLELFIAPTDFGNIQKCLAEKSLEAAPHYLPLVQASHSGSTFEASIHRIKGALILELESWPARLAVPDNELLSALKKMILRSRSAETVAEFCQRTAEDVRKFIGFDRVMVYRFDPDLSGHVIAEDKRGDLESYLGLHYPASDIPRQARELFRLSKLRLIPDLSYVPFPLIPNLRTDTNEPLDMSFCVTRSVSPIHVEYLQNMGVKASMSISIVIDDQLWGLFSCHHYTPRYVSHAGRTACDFLAHALAILVAGREQSEDFNYANSLHENQRLLNRAIASERDFDKAVRQIGGNSIGGIVADGAALVANGIVCLMGRTPSETNVLALANFFAASVREEVWSTDRLGESTPGAALIATGVSGILAARLSHEHLGHVFWFRSEVLQTVKWAGDVTKNVTSGPLGDRLTPRKSFALWKQEVRGRSQAWQKSEIVAAENVRHSYHELYAGQTHALVVMNAEVAQARDQAVRAVQAKDNFLATLSHELRTPLNPALLIASEEAENTALPENVRENFAAIRDNIELEARLIDDLLDISRISNGKVVLERRALGLHTVLRQALAILDSEFTSKPVIIVLDLAASEAVINADIVRLLQVFWNILKNAVKFTPKHGTITVTSRLDPTRGVAIVRVSDTGIGLKAEELPMIFQAFSQGEHATRGGTNRFGGLGLGLAITRSLLDAHGGKISVESPGVDQGSTFTVELPLDTTVNAQIPAPILKTKSNRPFPGTTNSDEPERKRILLVEDHAATRAGMTIILERRGYTVLQASTMTTALAIAASDEFALLISDIGLPDGDGYTLLRELLKIRPSIKAIALSGYGMDLDRQRSLEAGFMELLTKPINIQTLEKAILRMWGEKTR